MIFVNWALAVLVVLAVVVGAQALIAAMAVRGANPAQRKEILDALEETRFVNRHIVRMFRRSVTE